MQMDLIETFLDLCQTKSFNQTAERMGVTQSTVSARVKSLENSIGARLFTRSRSGTALTTAGLRFEPHARSLRHSWSSALHATKDTTLGGITMRLGLQHDLVGAGIRDLIAELRQTFSNTAFFLEADYSSQMCTDIISGTQDIAVLYSPTMQPDLYFEPLGEVKYVMVSTSSGSVNEIRSDTYILGNYAQVFTEAHAAALPELSQVSLSIGQNAGMVALLTSLSGTGYVLKSSADALVRSGTCQRVTDAPEISQPVYVGLNRRNRHRASYRKMIAILREHF